MSRDPYSVVTKSGKTIVLDDIVDLKAIEKIRDRLGDKELEKLDKILEFDRLMAKSILLNENDLTKGIGVIRGNHVFPGIWEIFAAIYTIGSNDGSCGITFETKEKNLEEGFARTVERMRIDATGHVGIGTTEPQSQLHLNVLESENPISAMTVDVQTFGNVANAKASSFFKVRDIGAEPTKGKTHFIIDGLGNVGIGKESPQCELDVKATRIKLGLEKNGGGQLHLANNPNDNMIYLEAYNSEGNSSAEQLVLSGAGAQNVPVLGIHADSTIFNGDIKVTGDVILTNRADCAEDFDIIGAESVEPGTVMVIDNNGALRVSEQAYDKRVAGVISGAGDYRPGITLDKQSERTNRLPLALTGKVFCKVDADYNRVEVGDLLTTSSTTGYAMKAGDRDKAFGAVIGKALRPMETGRGLIPILISLQ